MSASTYRVETVHSSVNDSLSDSRTQHFHRTPSESSSAFQPAAAALLPPPVPTSHQAMGIYQPPPPPPPPRTCQPHLIATISAGFEKGDYLIREERGCNVYFDFFEEAYNFAVEKGYTRMPKHEEMDYMEVIKRAHMSVPGGCRFNTGRLLMVLKKRLVPIKMQLDDMEEEEEESDDCLSYKNNSSGSSSLSQGKKKSSNAKLNKKLQLGRSTNTLPTDSESSVPSSAYYSSSAASSADTSYVDSWE
ncbi:hypothetical protein ACHAXR_001336 [Thalassiosira sp. AJA248-18]